MQFVFTDFDETLIPKKYTTNLVSLRQVEDYIDRNNFLYSWVSGSNYSYLIKRSTGLVSLWPDFIASSLGTEIHYHKANGEYDSYKEWDEMLIKNGVTWETLSKSIQILYDEIPDLEMQNRDYQGKNKRSYYLHKKISKEMIDGVVDKLFPLGFRLVVTKCSAMSGDPFGSYDVDLIPGVCGKGETVRYIKNRYRSEIGIAYGFGDSENDLEMLREVDRAFWVGNSELQGNSAIQKVSKNYTCGIYEALVGE